MVVATDSTHCSRYGARALLPSSATQALAFRSHFVRLKSLDSVPWYGAHKGSSEGFDDTTHYQPCGQSSRRHCRDDAALLVHGMRRVGLVFGIAAVLVCVSRVYVGTHYASDVIGGALTAVLAALLIPSLYGEGTRLDRLVTRIL